MKTAEKIEGIYLVSLLVMEIMAAICYYIFEAFIIHKTLMGIVFFGMIAYFIYDTKRNSKKTSST